MFKKVSIGVFIYLSLVCCNLTVAQTEKWKVLDRNDNTPIPFAHIAIAKKRILLSSNMDGAFNFPKNIQGTDLISITFVGYEKIEQTFASLKKIYPNNIIYLKTSTPELDEVRVTSGVNPAIAIVQEAVKRKDENDPLQLDNFYYQSYNKLVFKFVPEDSLIFNRENFDPNKKVEPVKLAKDTSEAKWMKSFLDKDLFLVETASEKYFKYPNKEKEIVFANRTSGLEQSSLAALVTDFQPFSFYKNYIKLLEKDFLNPLSPNSEKRYDFKLEGSFLTGNDTLFVIRFHPKTNKVFDGLQGVMHINSANYALANVIAEPSQIEDKILYRIQQHYEPLANGFHFPSKMRVFITSHMMENDGYRMLGTGDFYFDSIQVNNRMFGDRVFNDVILQIDPKERAEEESILAMKRAVPLDSKELRTYEFLDSVGDNPRFKRIQKLFEALSYGRWPLFGGIDLSLNKLLAFNKYENVRFGIGLVTNEQFSKNLELAAYTGYGLRDEAWKYGGSAKINLYRFRDLYFDFSYKNDIEEPASTSFYDDQKLFNNEIFRNFFIDRMDLIEEFSAGLHVKSGAFLGHRIGLTQKTVEPSYDYSYQQSEAFQLTELNYTLRFVKGERYTKVGSKKLYRGHAYPYFMLKGSRGFSSLLNGDFDYWRFTAKAVHEYKIPGIGSSKISAIGGYVEGDVPYSLLFNGRGASRNNNFFIDNHFQTMGIFEYTANYYGAIFLQQNLGYLGIEHKFSKPELHLIHNSGWGKFNNQLAHEGADFSFQDFSKGYHESGFMIKNILRADYLDVAYYNLHLGIINRLGAYALPNWQDNLSLLIGLEIGL